MAPNVLFTLCGKQLCGDVLDWPKIFARTLNITLENVDRMASGELSIPPEIWRKIAKWIVNRQRREPLELAALLTNISRVDYSLKVSHDPEAEDVKIHPRKIYDAAERYLYGRAVLQGDSESRIGAALSDAQRANGGRPPKQVTASTPGLMPSFVLLSLATELYLKCLIVLDREIERPLGHDYLLLFNMLTLKTRSRVKQYYDSLTPQNAFVEAVLKTKAGLPSKSFEESLELNRHAFEQTRYFYEDHSKAAFGMHIDAGIVEAVRAVLHEKRPNWPSLLPWRPSLPLAPFTEEQS